MAFARAVWFSDLIRRVTRPGRGTRMMAIGVSAVLMAGVAVMVTTAPSAKPAAAATTNTLSSANLHVKDADTNAPITPFQYIINEDNAGTTATQRSAASGTGCNAGDAGYPDSCRWTSNGIKSSAPIVTQGDQTDFDGAGINLSPGRYLISVLADGHKIDGAHFTVPLDTTASVDVLMNPTPIKSATLQAAVFEDISPVNSAPDLPEEHGLAGFRGNITDYLGQVTTDVFGGPLCTVYEENSDGSKKLDADGAPIPVANTGGNCFSFCYVVDNGVDIGVTDPDPAGRCPTIDTNLAPGDPTGLTYKPTPDTPASNGFAARPVPATAAIEGKIKIPNLGTNRYALSLIAPSGASWVQTTTLEGNHDWDAWVMENSTGLDTEMAVAGEPFPGIFFGYTPNSVNSLPASGATITGVVDAVKVYVPATGGTTQAGQIWGGLNGGKIDKPISQPWIALSDLTNGDQAVWVGRGGTDGKFTIPHVPDGNYTVSWWDEAQDYIFDLQNVSIVNGQAVDMGVLPLTGWWTDYSGYVFNDTNRNGKRDQGEPGVPNYTLTFRKRENSLMDRGTTTATTDANGYYHFEAGYPMTQWLVMEAYNDLYYTTGVTYQADNQPTPTTVLGAGVDVSTLPIIGLSGTMDWGVHSYDARGTNGIDPQNGGIVGTVSYDTTRNELDPRYAAVEDWQPGVSGITVELHQPESCLDPNTGDPLPAPVVCDATGQYQLNADGSYKLGQKLNTYVTETWQKPGAGNNVNGDGECIPRDVNGNELAYPAGQQITSRHTDCIEAPLMGVQFQKGFSTVDGNYGFGDGCFAPNHLDPTAAPDSPVCLDNAGTDVGFTALPGANDYLVKVVDPTDIQGRPQYKFTREEDINIANGDAIVPQVPPPACAGALHTVDVAGMAPDGPNATVNPTFVGIGGSPYEGQQRPLCDVKLVSLANGRSIVPTFNVFTDVPLPGRYWGLIIDDLTFSSDPHQINYGEKAGVRFAPIGIYDSTDRLVYTTESDYSGFFDVLMPSTNRISCPTPSGVCAGMFRFVGNDPGVPGRLNPSYNPGYRTIAAEFETFPGLITPADLAPTQVGVTVQLPNGQYTQVACTPDAARPQLFSVDKPYVNGSGTFTIKGLAFGATKGQGKVLFDGTTELATTAWSDTQITVTVPNSVSKAPHQLSVVADNGQSTVSGLTFHVFGGSYTPRLYEVGPTVSVARYRPANTLPNTANHALQNAIDDATAYLSGGGNNNTRNALVVVYPGLATPTNNRVNPLGAYYENLIVNAPVMIQGVGPGGFQGPTWVPGTILDGSAYGGDSAVATDWATKIGTITWAGNQTVNDGAAISIFAQNTGSRRFNRGVNANTTLADGLRARIDGLDIRGGDQQGFPANLNQIGGGPTGQPAVIQTQGGAVYANAYASYLQITNNTVDHNGGAYGAIRLGTPNVGSNNNDHIRIGNNRIVSNAGTNLAGAIGVFTGADHYSIDHNDLCGNFSAEYGGAISVYGRSGVGGANPTTDNTIDHNRLWFNQSYDEGGGIMIAGELQASPTALSPGSGPVNIHDNLIQQNLGNDDGGGIRFLMAGNFPMNVYNNMIVNNVSTHEGGGVALDDAPNVRFYNNTVMGNLTTATALTSDGKPAPAGLSTGLNSTPLQASLPNGSANWSNPTVFRNNIFWDNRAGQKSPAGTSGPLVVGLGQPGDPTPVNHWDFGTLDSGGPFAPANSVLQQTVGDHQSYTSSATNVYTNPLAVTPYDTLVTFEPWRTNPNFVGALLASVDGTATRNGDYHIQATSPAVNQGAATFGPGAPVSAPPTDIDGDGRVGAPEAGADELSSAFNVAVTKTDGLTSVNRGQAVTYTVAATNTRTGPVAGVTINDPVPNGLTNVTWTCAATGGSTCPAASGTGGIANRAITIGGAAGAAVTFTVTGTVSNTAGPTVTNTATVTTPAGDTNLADNTATDTDTVIVPFDVRVQKTDGRASTVQGGSAIYTVTIDKTATAGASTTVAVPGITVNDPSSPNLTIVSWTCASTGAGSSCGAASGTGPIANQTASLGAAANASVTYTVRAAVAATATGSVTNTATVTPPAGDTTVADNTAADVDTVVVAPTTAAAPALRDPFTRADANTLGGNWQQATALGAAGLRVNGNQAFCVNTGLAAVLCAGGANAYWNSTAAPTPAPVFNASQGAAFTFANTTVNGSSLILKATGTYNNALGFYPNAIRVRYDTGQVFVETTTDGVTFTASGILTGTFANGDTLTAQADANGNVFVWKTTGATTTYLGGASTGVTGGGRAGLRLAAGARVDDFKAGNL